MMRWRPALRSQAVSHVTARPDARPFSVLLVLFALTVLAWPNLFLRGELPVDGNVLRLFYPNWAFLHLHPPTLTEWPLWNPSRNMGEPFLANPQSLAAYPPMWLLCRLPSYLGFVRLWILGHTLLAAWFTRSWLLRSGADPAAAAVSTIVVVFNGYFIAHGTLLNHFASAAFVPVVFYYFSARRTIAFGIALAMQWLAGFPPFCFITVVALTLWTLSAGTARRDCLRLLWTGGLLAIGLAAFQLIPFVEFFVHSARPILLNPAVATEFSEPVGQLLRMLVVPQWMAWSRDLTGDQAVVTFYVGPIVMLAALWAVYVGGRFERRLLLGTIACAVLSLGSHLPGYAQFVPLHVFRFPANWLLLCSIGLAVLSGWGVGRLAQARWKWAAAGLILADLLTFAQYGRTPWFTPSFLDEPPPLARSVISDSAAHRLYHSPALVERLSRQDSKTFGDWLRLKNVLMPSYGTAFGLREASSYQVMKLVRAARYQARLAAEGPSSPLARWAGISTVVAEATSQGSTGPPQVQVMSTTDASPPVFFESSSSAQRAAVAVFRPGAIEAKVATDRPDTLVLSEVSYPGWVVRVDGQRAPSRVFQDTFQAVQVSAGEHVVRFDYLPLTFALGLAITLGTLGCSVVALRFRPARSPTHGDHNADDLPQVSRGSV